MPALQLELGSSSLPLRHQVGQGGLGGLSGLEYVSSAGLRVLIEAHMNMALKEGKMVLANVNETVMEIFDITGLSDVLTIK